MFPETTLFLETLFGRCAGQSDFITLSAIHPDGAHPTPSRHVPLGDTARLYEQVIALMEANALGWGAYVGVAPRDKPLGRWARGGKSDLAVLPALFVDLDHPDAATMQRVHDFAFAPSMVVQSGYGSHLYYLLSEPTHCWSQAERVLRGLAEWFGGDKAMTVAQSLRIPGSYNTKRNARAPCTLLHCDPQRLYHLDDFRPYAATPPPRPQYNHFPLADQSDLAPAITQQLCRCYGGYLKRNGWIAALCPCGHKRDLPGAHFFWHPQRFCAHCFGSHGRLSLPVLKTILRL